MWNLHFHNLLLEYLVNFLIRLVNIQAIFSNVFMKLTTDFDYFVHIWKSFIHKCNILVSVRK